MNTIIKSLALTAALIAGSFAGPRLDVTLEKNSNLARFSDENIGPGKTSAGVKLSMGDYSAKLNGFGENLKFTNPTLTVGVASNFLGMDRLNLSYDSHIVGVGVEKVAAVNKLVDLTLGAGLQRDKDSGIKSIPQVTAHIGLEIHVM